MSDLHEDVQEHSLPQAPHGQAQRQLPILLPRLQQEVQVQEQHEGAPQETQYGEEVRM